MAAFKWFVVTVTGIMLRADSMGGVTSVIRSLGLRPVYEPINRLFRSDAWNLKSVEEAWQRYVASSAALIKVGGYAIIAGDGIKVSKEGKRIPGVKRLHQESDNSSKPEYISGLMYGGVGVLAGNGSQEYCIPLACEVQDGIAEIMKWDGNSGARRCSHVVEMITLAHHSANAFGKALVTLDRYFLTVPALDRLRVVNMYGNKLEAIIMAKASTIAYEKPSARLPGMRGRTRVKGASIKLANLFEKESDQFKEIEIEIYGKRQKIKYHSVNLLWGQGLYQELQFVLVDIEGRRVIIACTDTGLEPLDVIVIYAKRFKIESTFKSLKHDVAAFAHRFWTLAMPKLNRFAKKSDPDRHTKVKNKSERKKVRQAFDASERYVFCGLVALGILQMLSLSLFSKTDRRKFWYLRTMSKAVPSVATVADYMRKSFFQCLVNEPDLAISQIIKEKSAAEMDNYYALEVS